MKNVSTCGANPDRVSEIKTETESMKRIVGKGIQTKVAGMQKF